MLELNAPVSFPVPVPIVMIKNEQSCYGLVVERVLGEKELVVQHLPPQLGKVSGIIAGALMEDGSPVLIIDVGELAFWSEA